MQGAPLSPASVLSVVVSTVSAFDAAILIRQLAQTDSTHYLAALHVLLEHVPWTATDAGSGVVSTLREHIRRVVYTVVRDMAYGHPDRWHCCFDDRCDGRRIWAMQLIRPWCKHLRLPEPCFGECKEDAHLRFRRQTLSDRRRNKDMRHMATAFLPLVRDVPLAYASWQGNDRWSRHMKTFGHVQNRRLGQQTEHHILNEMKNGVLYIKEHNEFYTTTRGEVLFAYEGNTPRLWEPYDGWDKPIQFRDPLLVRVFKALRTWDEWRTMLALLPSEMRFEFHYHHKLRDTVLSPGGRGQYGDFRFGVWVAFLPDHTHCA